jgi:hypothetical protein
MACRFCFSPVDTKPSGFYKYPSIYTVVRYQFVVLVSICWNLLPVHAQKVVQMQVFEQLQKWSTSTVLTALFASWLVYLLALTIYRLYLSPLARFPGPKLAALTKWYEFYYEVVLRGQFTFHVQDLHKIYGNTSQSLTLEAHGIALINKQVLS